MQTQAYSSRPICTQNYPVLYAVFITQFET